MKPKFTNANRRSAESIDFNEFEDAHILAMNDFISDEGEGWIEDERSITELNFDDRIFN